MHRIFDEHGIAHNGESVFDMLIKKANLLLQSGTPGFEYERSDMSSNVRFIGALLPYNSDKPQQQWFDQRLHQYSRVVLVTQGTVEKDIDKIIVPTLEAFKNTDTLVIATTGGSGTAVLKKKYQQDNIIIEDFIPFADVMPHADVYITNGGYGGVMLGIENRLPMVAAGTHEGKNEICARIGFFELGINLRTETPTALQIQKAAREVMDQEKYKQNVIKLGEEFDYYDPYKLSTKYISALLQTGVRERELEVVS
jgi:UDP:flavonoid glycosyltransferase YjiC (YdhE family)